MKKIILDTDMGVDCDDACALALLANAHNKKQCELIGVTASTSREGATSTIKHICNYYDLPEIPIGALINTQLQCDKENTYGKAVMDQFGNAEVCVDAVKVLRKLLNNCKEKVTIISIGPLTNMADLLKSQPDECSELSGYDLVKNNVEEVFTMGGTFTGDYAEWNILQDVNSAIYFNENCPARITYLPHEVGNIIQTVMGNNFENPVWYSMKSYANYYDIDTSEGFSRCSWDPVTCMLALKEYKDLFDFSEFGNVTIDSEGKTSYSSQASNQRRYVTMKSKIKQIEATLNTLVEKNS